MLAPRISDSSLGRFSRLPNFSRKTRAFSWSFRFDSLFCSSEAFIGLGAGFCFKACFFTNASPVETCVEMVSGRTGIFLAMGTPGGGGGGWSLLPEAPPSW
jgi:hypothetical protein